LARGGATSPATKITPIKMPAAFVNDAAVGMEHLFFKATS